MPPPSPDFSFPAGVAVDAAGNIYVVDFSRETVYRFCTGVPALGATPTDLGTVTADSTGAFTESFAVPCRVGGGDHTITATGPLGQSASATVTLTDCDHDEHDREPAPVAVPVVSTPAFTG